MGGQQYLQSDLQVAPPMSEPPPQAMLSLSHLFGFTLEVHAHLFSLRTFNVPHLPSPSRTSPPYVFLILLFFFT